MESILDKLKIFFSQNPLPHSVLQVTSSYISGIHLSSKDKKLKNHFVLPLPGGTIQPSFEKTNLKDLPLLEKQIKDGVEKFNTYDHGTALLLPELSQRTFVFTFDSLPPTSKEKERLIRFRVKKQMPLLAEDVRISYDVVQAKNKKRVVLSLARAAVVNEYENFFSRLQLKICLVGVPILALANLIDLRKEKDFFLINIERDSFGLLAVAASEIFLYRQKPLMGRRKESRLKDNIQNIVQEIENTAQFIQDKERRDVASIWVRLGLLEPELDIFSQLESSLSFPFKRVESLVDLRLPEQEKRILAPLWGQLQ
jgi:hypothetical protein